MLDIAQINPDKLHELGVDQLRELTHALLQRTGRDAQELIWRDAKLTVEIAQLKRMQFGVKSEQLSADQRALFDEAVDGDIAAIEEQIAALQATLLKLWPALWGFIDHPGVAPTNNAAEQALRGIVLKRKISGPTRSRRGDEFIARGYSVHETCRRQGLDLWAYLHHAVIAWIDKRPHPGLLPAPTG